MVALRKRLQNYKRGQALIELTLIFPMLLTLALGAVEVANIIYTYQVMHRLTAQGANIASRPTTSLDIPSSCTALGTALAPYCAIMNKVIDAACPTISQGSQTVATCPPPNAGKWRVIFTEIGPDISKPDPKPYVVLRQIVNGAGDVNDKRICTSCGLAPIDCDPTASSCVTPDNIPNIDNIGSGQNLYAFEVFYDYSPITVLGNFVGDAFTGKFYERSIF